MRLIRGFRGLGLAASDAVVTIGNFDGVHRGHQEVIRSVVEDAQRRGGRSVVCTFDPHTGQVLRPQDPPRLLQTLDQRLATIADLDPDVIVVIPFDKEIASTSRRDFVTGFLVDELKTVSLHVSKGFTFGRSGAGTVDYLLQRAPNLQIVVIPPLEIDGQKLSSTLIRSRLQDGDVEGIAASLGRPYALIGRIVPGAGRGKDLSTPTANLKFENGCLPRTGVYVTEATLDGKPYLSVSNVGYRPTFGDTEELIVEAHFLNFSRNIYNARVELAFLARLRDERRFATRDELMAQIGEDVRAASDYFDRPTRARDNA